MTEQTEELVLKIIGFFSEHDTKSIPLDIIIQKISTEYSSEDVERAIESAMDQYLVDKVLDYPDDEWNLYGGRPIWHILKLDTEEADKLQNLKPVNLALLRLLKTQTDVDSLGEIKSEDVRTILIEQGFNEDDVRSLWIEGYVDYHYDFENDRSIEWCRLIPENEKTEEYKREEERIQDESARKESFRMYITDVHELADGILKAVREAPRGISKKDIIEQLFMDDPKYLDHAFEIATEEDEILPIILDTGEEGYRYNPEFADRE